MTNILVADGLSALTELETWARDNPRAGGECHIVMHDIGRTRAMQQLEADADAELPDGNEPNCTAGYTHGAIMAMVDHGGRRALATIEQRCSEQATPLGKKGCFHGMGHSFMRMTEGNPREAGVMCRALGSAAADCWPGVFHDYALGLDRTDGADTTDPIEKPSDLCNRAGATRQPELEACWVWALGLAAETAATPARVDEADEIRLLCGSATAEHVIPCHVGAGEYMSRQPGQVTPLVAACAGLDADRRDACLRGLATGMAEMNSASPRTAEAYLRACSQLFLDAAKACARIVGRTAAYMSSSRRVPACGSVAERLQAACRSDTGRFRAPLGIF